MVNDMPRCVEMYTRPWERWWAWRPVKINGHRQWFKLIYRRQVTLWVDNDMQFYYKYGTIFDVLGDDK